jgi:hypothetical protein
VSDDRAHDDELSRYITLLIAEKFFKKKAVMAILAVVLVIKLIKIKLFWVLPFLVINSRA